VLTAALGGAAVVALAVAAIGLASGGPSPHADRAALAPSPWIDGRSAGLGLRGAF
jgi:hypothetical protein